MLHAISPRVYIWCPARKTEPLLALLLSRSPHPHAPSGRSKIRAAVAGHLQHNPAAEIMITGHSLGGALATLCFLDLERTLGVKVPFAPLYIYGAPRVGNAAFAAYCRGVIAARCKAYSAVIAALRSLPYATNSAVPLTVHARNFLYPLRAKRSTTNLPGIQPHPSRRAVLHAASKS